MQLFFFFFFFWFRWWYIFWGGFGVMTCWIFEFLNFLGGGGRWGWLLRKNGSVRPWFTHLHERWEHCIYVHMFIARELRTEYLENLRIYRTYMHTYVHIYIHLIHTSMYIHLIYTYLDVPTDVNNYCCIFGWWWWLGGGGWRDRQPVPRAKLFCLRFCGRIEFVARFTLILDKHFFRSWMGRGRSGPEGRSCPSTGRPT